jgi:hypothetical protein
VEYFLKWKDYHDGYNTWEPRENLGCKGLIADFEKDLTEKLMNKNKKRRKSGSPDLDLSYGSTSQKRKSADGIRVRGFGRGLEPDSILGATQVVDKMMFLVKWKGCEETDLISFEEAREKCPQIVIDYYQSLVKWEVV